jgi:hypothetical protein
VPGRFMLWFIFIYSSTHHSHCAICGTKSEFTSPEIGQALATLNPQAIRVFKRWMMWY